MRRTSVPWIGFREKDYDGNPGYDAGTDAYFIDVVTIGPAVAAEQVDEVAVRRQALGRKSHQLVQHRDDVVNHFVTLLPELG